MHKPKDAAVNIIIYPSLFILNFSVTELFKAANWTPFTAIHM